MLKAQTLYAKTRNMNDADREVALFEAKQSISPILLNFGLKMFSSFQLRKWEPTFYDLSHE